MAQPTLVYGGTTVTLPHPSAAPMPQREYATQSGNRRTVAGHLRTWVAPYWYVYTLSFIHCDRATYDSVVSLVRTAAAANAYPTFTWAAGAWPSATSGIATSVEVSPTKPSGPDLTYVDFSLTLTESTGRTT